MRTDSVAMDEHLSSYLAGECRSLNAQLPKNRKTLSELLRETAPFVELADGSCHSIRRSELDFITSLIGEHGAHELLLPILIEIGREDSISVRSDGDIEGILLSIILDMPLISSKGKLTIYRSHLECIRSKLKTTTQYVFLA